MKRTITILVLLGIIILAILVFSRKDGPFSRDFEFKSADDVPATRDAVFGEEDKDLEAGLENF